MVSRAPGSAKSCLSFKMKACPKCEPRFCLQSNLTTVSLIARMPLQVGGVIFHVDAEASASCRFRESFMFSAGSGKRADRRSCTRRNIRSHSRDNADGPLDRLPNPAAWRRIPASRGSHPEWSGPEQPGREAAPLPAVPVPACVAGRAAHSVRGDRSGSPGRGLLWSRPARRHARIPHGGAAACKGSPHHRRGSPLGAIRRPDRCRQRSHPPQEKAE